MNNNSVKKFVKKCKLKTFSRKVNTYKFVSDYDKLKKMTYTILTKPRTIKTIINGKLENKVKLERGDYVICGVKKEKYGLPLEKVLNTYDLNNIKNKKIVRKGVQLSKGIKKFGVKSKKIQIIPSWGGVQNLQVNDYILFEEDMKKGYYGIEKGAFKKTYN